MNIKSASRRHKNSAKKASEPASSPQRRSLARHDEHLLDIARTQWQFGDWQSLAAMKSDGLQHHPERAELALLAAAGQLQINQIDLAMQFIHMARDWGCSSESIARILAAGVHNSLARAAFCTGDPVRAYRNFESAILLGACDSDIRLITEARAAYQYKLLGLDASSTKQNETGGASGAKLTQFEAYLVKIKLRIGNIASIDLGFNACRASWLSIRQDGDIDYRTESGAPLYLVSNEAGDFEKPPHRVQVSAAADTSYVLSGKLVHSGDNLPVVWIFQYAGGRKIDAQAINIEGGGIYRNFTTLPATESIAIGIRLMGCGRLILSGTSLSLQKQASEDFIKYFNKKFELIEQSQKRDVENSMRQIEACIRLQHYLGSDIILPGMHNWPISPDFGVLLVNLVEQNGYQGVIEFGSGTSTLILAKALERVARREGTLPATLLSFDHLKEYRTKTQSLINQAGLAAHTNVVLAPLVAWRDAEDNLFSYYACDKALQMFKQRLPESGCRLLVIVDGPPAATGKHARYPALSRVLEILGRKHGIDFLLDDYLRSEEQEVVARWLDTLITMKLQHTCTEFNNLEKKACLVSVCAAQQGENG